MPPGVVAEVLAGLWHGHRQVIVALYYRGCTVTEAAAVLGITPPQVKTRALHGLYAFRLALEERGLSR